MNARIAKAVLWIGLLTPPLAAQEPRPELRRLREHVETLASPAFQGRRGPGAVKAAEYIVDALRQAKLEPLFGDDFTQLIPGPEAGTVQGRNVGAVLRGSDPSVREEWVIVSAHFDHLGVRGGVLYPGADDNATGVAMVLEVARAMAASAERPRRSVAFVGFDLEEVGLFGSRYFVEHAPMPLAKVALFVTADMLGRSFAGVPDETVFVMGTEHSPELRPWLAQAADRQPVKVGLLGTDLLVLNRSDYGPFRSRQVPYLFFSTGENPLYHSPADTPETIQYAKLEAISRIIQGVARRAAGADSVPRWSSTPDNPLDEAITVRDTLRKLYANRQALGLGPAQVLLIGKTLKTADAIVDRGSMDAGERAALIRAARLVLFTVL